MSKEKKVLDELDKLEQEQVKDNTTRILEYVRNIPAVPIEITLSGKGNKGRLEVVSFLKILKQLREVKYLHEEVDDRTQTIKAEILRKQRRYEPEITGKPLIETYETPGEMLLQISDDGRGVLGVKLRENLETGGQSKVEKLINILKTWANVENINIKEIKGKGGEKIGSDTILEIKGIKKLTSLEDALLKQIKLYENTQKSLFEIMNEVKKKIKLNPKELVDEIQFYTNLEGVDLDRLKERTKIAYSLRELYGIIETENNVTMDQIQSNEKTRPIAENRHALMYLCVPIDFLR